MSAARWRSSRVCAGLHSAPVRRSVDKEIGATREVVVIRFIPWPQRGRRPAEWQSQPHRKRKPALEFFQEPLRREFAESLPQLFAARTDVLEKLFLFHDAQKFERHGASQRPAAEGSAMHSGRHARGHRFGCKNGAKRKTAGKRLGDQDDIRLSSKFLIGKVAPGAAEPALDLVGNQQRAMS